MAQLVAKTYADALMEAALETGRLREIQSEIGFVTDALSENGDFYELFSTPSLGTTQKKDVIEEVFGKHLSPEVMNFFRLLIDKERGSEIFEIRRLFDHLIDVQDGLVKGKVITAVEMTQAQIKSLEEKLSTLAGKTVTLKNVIDEDIVGGIVVEIGDKIIDGSVRKQLAELKEELRQVIV
jgi:F-type H+-transporting ATPase subunit delta